MQTRHGLVLRLTGALLCVIACAGSLSAQVARTPDGVDALVRHLEDALSANDQRAFDAVFASTVPPDQLQRYFADLIFSGAIHTVVRERDRAQLEGAPEGEGYRLVVELFAETRGRARILTAGLDVRRPHDGDESSWRIVLAEGLTSVEGLFRLRLNTMQYAAREFEITAEDLALTLHDGSIFLVDSDDGVTGMLLIGRGEMRFAPAPLSERGQLRIFAGGDTLTTPFESAFIRLSPGDYRRRIASMNLTPATPDSRIVRRAQELFARESPKSFNVDLQDLSRDLWHLLPPATDFLAEIQTRRYGVLTYSRANAQAEDITLLQREHRRTIALYPSVAKLAARGRFYTDDAGRDFDVLDYNIEASVNPDRQFIEGRARLAIRVRASSLSTVILRLAEPLAVTSVTSVEYGRLLHLRVRNQNSVLINMPRMVLQDSDITLLITYAGRLMPQDLDTETVQTDSSSQIDSPLIATEPNFLLSNRSYWYPQNPVPDYATATVRVTVPAGFTCVASGQPLSGAQVVTMRDLVTLPGGKAFAFRADQPLRYLAFVISRFVRVVDKTITIESERDAFPRSQIAIAVEANPRLQSRGRALARPTEEILRFYTSLIAEAPYASVTVALVESDLPGGHSPGYFAVLNEPSPSSQLNWRNDPAAFTGFPDFFLAHELAHQWWGQAIGWKNYHEQWISEGFAQYFAALYAEKSRGDRVFGDMLRQFRRWALSESDQGPVYLGYRLGHIKGDLRVFRALVYNKGAAVLHMLRRMLGDEVFFAGLRQFYDDRKFQKAGTDDLKRAFEITSGLALDRFFERWIYGTETPRVTYRATVGDRDVTVRFEQLGDLVFDIPVTVSLVYGDGRSKEVVVTLTSKVVEQKIPADAAVRQVLVNKDSGSLAEFEESR